MVKPKRDAGRPGRYSSGRVSELPVIHQDEAVIAFDQPGGEDPPVPPGLMPVQRLDAGASGVLLCARTKAALDSLTGQFQAKSVERVLLALCTVLPPEAGEALRAADGRLPREFTVDRPLGPDPRRPERMILFKRSGGRPGSTRFRVLEDFGPFAWIECRPVTGRRHQVRLHLAAARAPVLGDELYGRPGIELRLSGLKRGYKGREEERPLVRRLALHTAELTVAHPLSGQPLRLAAPVAPDLEIALKCLRRYRRGAPPTRCG